MSCVKGPQFFLPCSEQMKCELIAAIDSTTIIRNYNRVYLAQIKPISADTFYNINVWFSVLCFFSQNQRTPLC